MKIAGAVLLFSLALSCLYLDAAGQIEEDMCSMYEYPPEVCPDVYSPICGTDGITYSNECEFCAAYLESPDTVSFEHYGECEPYADELVARSEL